MTANGWDQHRSARAGNFLTRQAAAFQADRSGSMAIIAALLILPILLFIGIAVDLSFAYGKRLHIQDAADNTVLAVIKEVGVLDDTELTTLANKMMAANLPSGEDFTITKMDIGRDPASVKLDAKITYKTSFMQLAHIETVDVSVSSEAVSDGASLEIALVLDNSGSMSGSRIVSLREAAKNFTNRLFQGSSSSDKISISVVPFSGMVNVGANQRGSLWLDMGALNTEYQEMGLAEGANRWDLYDGLKNVTWRGCVEARKHPYDVEDTLPTIVTPHTLFMPSFAPDEPDSGSYYNNYLTDSSSGHKKGYGGYWTDNSSSSDEDLSKYANAYADTSYYAGTQKGPNFLCDSDPITPLTGTKSTILSAINAMDAYGGTNMHLGVMWGWRVLSPGTPFTEGRPYTEKDNAKIIVLMSDGANQIIGTDNNLMSVYSAYHYAKFGRLGTPSVSSSKLESQMNERTLEACTNAKDAGIKIITIAFDIDNKAATNLLKSCASSSAYAYTANNTSELEARFEEIAKGLQKMRIAF